MELYFLRGKKANGDTLEPQMTDAEHLEKAIKELKWSENVDSVYVNKAVMCLDGMFGNGEYMGEY